MPLNSRHVLQRATAYAETLSLRMPILLAPMAGACPTSLSATVAKSGGMGACGALLMKPEGIANWAEEFRVQAGQDAPFQINTWIPDPAPARNLPHEAELMQFLSQWGPAVDEHAANSTLVDFPSQCQAMIEAQPSAISSIMGLYPDSFVAQMKVQGIKWFAIVTTVAEAKAASAAGADAIIAQGMEAGGHRGSFDEADAENNLVGLLSLIPAVADATDLPIIATGGIADARGAAAALLLGASAVQIGTGYLRSPEAGTNSAWADALNDLAPEDTTATRAFSGRLGRSVRTAYVDAVNDSSSPGPAPYPIQRNLTAAMRMAASSNKNIDGMQAWAGQSAAMAKPLSAAVITREIWEGVQTALS